MIPYIIVFILLLIPVLKYRGNQLNRGNNYFIFEVILLILFMGLRYRVGGDSLRYELYYEYQPQLKDILNVNLFFGYDGFQPFWNILVSSCKSISEEFWVVQLIQSAIINSVFCIYASKNCEHRFTFVLLYYVFNYPYYCTEIMRESIAVAVFMVGFNALINKQYKWYIITCVSAFMFHASAIFLFGLPFFYIILQKFKGTKGLLAALSIIVVVLLSFDFLMETLLSTVFSGNSMLMSKSEGVANSTGLNIFGIMMQIVYLVPCFIAYKIYSKSEHYDQKKVFVIIMYMIVALISTVYVPLTRLQNYFAILFLVYFSDLLYLKYFKESVVLALAILVYAKIGYYNRPIINSSGQKMTHTQKKMYIPYSSIFDKTIDIERERVIQNQF